MSTISVIITTYNSETWLEKVLWGYAVQSFTDFELIIADDGSTSKTKDLLDSFKSEFKHPIVHVWQEDNGFQKTKILNKAIVKASSSYILFSDGDCIPRRDFIATHLKHKKKGYFLSGGYFKLNDVVSNSIDANSIKNQSCFQIKWLLDNGLKLNFKISKLTQNSFFGQFMNWITPTKKTFNGHNTSCFKEDLIAVNGFNEEMKYGGLDREIGERLFNNKIKSKQIRYSAICLHLNHDRSYATKDNWLNNNYIRKFNKQNNVTTIKNGLSKYLNHED
ncbi:glycosyltransferase family 2 protein [Flavobacterium terrigena]|uniref:Glycosyltransferase involved in cell wall bisynthesis n=1 Tax=Flavobacterium terrigena TaxID=402734 RepID=A0A1H6QP18_9FLAO|nr:glycosyltransferase family 2 protein [Flavobacterium terrigena]SEI45359.1 Glycosyltransferase involved in cell wall bisynthesis [Flavobacterium terrigena]